MQIYVVLCQTAECDECTSTTHVVGVFLDEKDAEVAELEHSAEKPHFHYNWCWQEKVELHG